MVGGAVLPFIMNPFSQWPSRKPWLTAYASSVAHCFHSRSINSSPSFTIWNVKSGDPLQTQIKPDSAEQGQIKLFGLWLRAWRTSRNASLTALVQHSRTMAGSSKESLHAASVIINSLNCTVILRQLSKHLNISYWKQNKLPKNFHEKFSSFQYF